MKIGEGLQKVNYLKGQLSRLQNQRSRLFKLSEDSVIEYEFDDITTLIEEKHREIGDIKNRIQKANMKVNVNVDGVEYTLFDAILKLGIIRSELSQFNDLIAGGSSFSFLRDEEKKYHIPITQKDLEQRIQELEMRKRLLDHSIQGVNWSVELE